MERKRNYQRELDAILERSREEGRVPRLLLHSCCAPCSSYVLEYLAPQASITAFYYNPNITEETEYRKRVQELRRLIAARPRPHPVTLLEGAYEPERFFAAVKGLEAVPEGGARCLRCFRLRLFEAARVAAEGGFDYFTTSLTISPLKDAAAINAIGEEAAAAFQVPWLPSDFKKKGGYARSIELSRELGLYRQDYCGCIFSKRRDLDLHKKEEKR